MRVAKVFRDCNDELAHLSLCHKYQSLKRGCSAGDSLTWDREVAGLSLIKGTVYVLEQDTLFAAEYQFNPRRPVSTRLLNCFLGCQKSKTKTIVLSAGAYLLIYLAAFIVC